MQVTLREAETQLSALGKRAWAGERIVIAQDGEPYLELIPHQRIIHILGSTGGGRDTARRPILGGIAGERADLVIVTNEDPYDDDPQEIIDQVAAGAEEKGKIIGENLLKILDRREAIHRAFEEARENDLVMITGKGGEQFICSKNNEKIPWDDRLVAKEELNNLFG